MDHKVVCVLLTLFSGKECMKSFPHQPKISTNFLRSVSTSCTTCDWPARPSVPQEFLLLLLYFLIDCRTQVSRSMIDTVDTVDMVYSVDMVYTVDRVFTVDTFDIVFTAHMDYAIDMVYITDIQVP